MRQCYRCLVGGSSRGGGAERLRALGPMVLVRAVGIVRLIKDDDDQRV